LLARGVSSLLNRTPPPETPPLPLPDALPISGGGKAQRATSAAAEVIPRVRPTAARGRATPPALGSPTASAASWPPATPDRGPRGDRKSTRLNSSHVKISYAVFCLKKKKKQRE